MSIAHTYAAPMSPPREDRVPPFCLGCRYSLKGLRQGECPECGRPFDLSDHSTVAWEYRRHGAIWSLHRSAALMLIGSAAIIVVAAGHGAAPLALWAVLAPLEEGALEPREAALAAFPAIGALLLIACFVQRPGLWAMALLGAGACAVFAAFGVALHYSADHWQITVGSAIPFFAACGFTGRLILRSLRR